MKRDYRLEHEGKVQAMTTDLPSINQGRLFTYSWLIKVEYGRYLTLNWMFSDITAPEIFFRLYDGLTPEYPSLLCQISNNSDHNIQDRILTYSQCDKEMVQPLQLSGNVSSQFNALTIQLTLSDYHPILFSGSYASHNVSEVIKLCENVDVAQSIIDRKSKIISGAANSPFSCSLTFTMGIKTLWSLKILHFVYLGWNTNSCENAGLIVYTNDTFTPYCSFASMLNNWEDNKEKIITGDFFHLYVFCGKHCFGFSMVALLFEKKSSAL